MKKEILTASALVAGVVWAFKRKPEKKKKSGKNRVFYGSDKPNPDPKPDKGDLWLNWDTGKMSAFNGKDWDII